MANYDKIGAVTISAHSGRDNTLTAEGCSETGLLDNQVPISFAVNNLRNT